MSREMPPRELAVVAAEFPPVGGGGVIRVTKLVKYLLPLGWLSTVITSDEPLANAYDDSLLAEIPEEVRVQRVRPPLQGAISTIALGAKRRAAPRSPAFRMLKAGRAAVRTLWAVPDARLPWALLVSRLPASAFKGVEVIVTSGPPHSVHLAGARLSRRLGLPYVADLRDEWTLRPSARRRGWPRRIVERRLERWALSHAARVVVMSEASRVRYETRYPFLSSHLAVIPNGYDPADLADIAAPPRSNGEALTLGYAGSFQDGLNVDPIARGIATAMSDLERDGIAVRVHLVGPFQPAHLDQLTRWISTERLTVEGFVPHRAALTRMASWDATLVIADDGSASLAGKTYECLALRRPIAVLAPKGPAVDLVTLNGAGTAGAPDDWTAVASAVRGALALSLDPAFPGAPRDVIERFDRQRQAAVWAALLDEVSQKAP